MFEGSLTESFKTIASFPVVYVDFWCPLQYLWITEALSKNCLAHLSNLFVVQGSDLLFFSLWFSSMLQQIRNFEFQ